MKMRQALEVLGAFTSEQWGLVTSRQAIGLGVEGVTLHRMEKAGYLDRVRRGVYAATTATVTDAREEQAAWLALNAAEPAWTRPLVDPGGGVISHQSAARLHGLGELVTGRITMTTTQRRTSRDPDLWFKVARLAGNDVTAIDGLPVTTALRTICDLLDQHIDGSHIATIIRQAVGADLVRLDALAEHIGPYALRYGVRRPGDGEALLEQFLAEIGTTTARLAQRPAPPRTAAATELGRLFAEYASATTPIAGGLTNSHAFSELAAEHAGSPLVKLESLLGKDMTARLVQDIVGASAFAEAAKPRSARGGSDGTEDTGSATDAAAGDDSEHGTAATGHTPRLRRLTEGKGEEQIEGDRDPRG